MQRNSAGQAASYVLGLFSAGLAAGGWVGSVALMASLFLSCLSSFAGRTLQPGLSRPFCYYYRGHG